MKVRMRCVYVHSGGIEVETGAEVDVPQDEGLRLVAGGHADQVDSPVASTPATKAKPRKAKPKTEKQRVRRFTPPVEPTDTTEDRG